MSRRSSLATSSIVGPVFLALACSWAVGAPLPAGKESLTETRFREGLKAYALRRVEDYRRLTTDPAAIRDRAASYLEKAERSSLIGAGTKYRFLGNRHEFNTAMRDEGARLIKEGSTDALVLSVQAAFCASVIPGPKEVAGGVTRFEKAEEAFARAPYRAVGQMQSAIDEVQFCRIHSLGRLKQAMARLRKVILAAMEEESEPKNVRYVWRLFNTEFYDEASLEDEKALWEAAQRSEKAQPWLRCMVGGRYFIVQAWHLRGDASAANVTDEGWKGFAENLAKAAAQLKKAHGMLPSAPEAATWMIPIAMAGHEKLSTRDWFDRAVAAQFDYMPAYAKLSWAMLPRWGGSHQEMLDFGEECAKTGRFDTVVPWQMIVVIESTGNEVQDEKQWAEMSWMDTGTSDDIWYVAGHYAAAKPVFEGYAACPESPFDKRHIQTRHLWAAACAGSAAAGAYADGRKLADALGGRYDVSVFRNGNARPKFAISRVYACSGPAADQCEEAEMLIFRPSQRKQPKSQEKALKLLVEAEKIDTDPKSALYFLTRKNLLQRTITFNSGQWIDYTFHPGFPSEYLDGGKWTYEDPHHVAGESRFGEMLRLRSDLNLEGPLEVELDLEPLQNKFGMWAVGVSLGRLQPVGKDYPNGRVFWVGPQRREVGVTPGFTPPKASKREFGKKIHLHVRAWPETHEFYVDGACFDYVPEGRFDCGMPLMLGNLMWVQGAGKTRFGNLRIRKLSYGPPPEFEDAAGRVKYFTRFLEDYPQYAHPRFLRGVALYYTHEYEKAYEDFQKADQLGKPERFGDFWKGATLHELGDDSAAVKAVLRHVEKMPDHSLSHQVLSLIYATSHQAELRDAKKAVQEAELAVKYAKKPDFALSLALAKAYAADGQFDKALTRAKEAGVRASDQQQAEVQQCIELFEAHKPYYRDPPKPKAETKKNSLNQDKAKDRERVASPSQAYLEYPDQGYLMSLRDRC